MKTISIFFKLKSFAWFFALIVFISNPVIFAQEEAVEIAPMFPPGAVATFPELFVKTDEKLPVIYIKRKDAGEGGDVWLLDSQEIALIAETETETTGIFALPPASVSDPSNTTSVAPASSSSVSASPPSSGLTDSLPPASASGIHIGFIIPQLPRGSYTVWYESMGADRPGQTMIIDIDPKLLPSEALIADNAGKEVQVKVGIASIYVLKKGETSPREISVPIRLDIENSRIAELAPGQNETAVTDKDGSATWRIRIKETGSALLTARAVGFEPAQLIVVGESQPATSEQIAAAENAERTAKEKISRLEDKIRARQGGFSRRAEIALGKSSILGVGVDRRAEITIAEAEEAANRAAVTELERAREELRNARERLSLVLPPPPGFTADDLKPGDVLLTLSNSFISQQILSFERSQLGGHASYSHASLYVGKINGKPMVAEMWSSGYWITPLEVSIAGTTIVDVIRWKGITDAKRAEIARIGLNIFGDPARCTKNSAPTITSGGLRGFCGVPYAYEGIAVLAKAATGMPKPVLKGAAFAADKLAGGRRKMICSEFVAWVYLGAGLDPQVNQWWASLESVGIISNNNRRKDYTTPNMLGNSPLFESAGRLKGLN